MILLRRVAGGSMLPALRPGQVVVAIRATRRLVRPSQVGQIVIIRHDGLDKIKRVSQVRDDRIFVVGDNPEHSTDSRHFGWLPAASIRGRVVWPRPL